MYKGIKYMVLSALLCILSCTTEVDICMEDSHLHLAEVEISYDLTGVPESTVPDSMIVVAYRVLRSWKCSYMAPCTEETSIGRYIYNSNIKHYLQPQLPLKESVYYKGVNLV